MHEVITKINVLLYSCAIHDLLLGDTIFDSQNFATPPAYDHITHLKIHQIIAKRFMFCIKQLFYFMRIPPPLSLKGGGGGVDNNSVRKKCFGMIKLFYWTMVR